MELKNIVAVITGSTGQLGSQIALALAQTGCVCICHYHKNKSKANDLVVQIKHLGPNALAIPADLTNSKQIENLFVQADQLGTPQILINSAAVFSRQPLTDVTLEEARKVLDLNLTAAILTSRAFAKRLNDKFPAPDSVIGKIANISGIAGVRPWAQYVIYCCSKAGLIGATKALAKELAPYICVNSVAPGLVTWPADFTDRQKQRQLKLIPLARKAEPKDITAAITFLLKNDYITGQVLNIDGGKCI